VDHRSKTNIVSESRRRPLRQVLGALPLVGPFARRLYRIFVPRRPELAFAISAQYWNDRYAFGGNSGAGSYGRLARFKAEVINNFVAQHGVRSVIEFGSGDGAQLELAQYPHYTGVDVSAHVVALCREKFARDSTKQFFHTSYLNSHKIGADLAMSLDVIYHLVEDEVFDAYMSSLVVAAEKYICIYSSNFTGASPESHVRHRCFTDWLAERAPHWQLISKVPNLYPADPRRPSDTSWADFYFFGRDPKASTQA
jgi:hypothetical protein